MQNASELIKEGIKIKGCNNRVEGNGCYLCRRHMNILSPLTKSSLEKYHLACSDRRIQEANEPEEWKKRKKVVLNNYCKNISHDDTLEVRQRKKDTCNNFRNKVTTCVESRAEFNSRFIDNKCKRPCIRGHEIQITRLDGLRQYANTALEKYNDYLYDTKVAAEPELDPKDIEKNIRKLEKKLKQIETLEKNQSVGKKLNREQIKKISKKSEFMKELNYLTELLFTRVEYKKKVIKSH
jgi:hypothetical protein